MQEYYHNEPRFNRVYSRDNLHKKIKDGLYIINLDEYSNTGTHWISLYVLNNNNVTYFDSFGVDHIPKEIEKKLSMALPLKQIFIEYQHMIQECVDIFALDLLILC